MHLLAEATPAPQVWSCQKNIIANIKHLEYKAYTWNSVLFALRVRQEAKIRILAVYVHKTNNRILTEAHINTSWMITEEYLNRWGWALVGYHPLSLLMSFRL